MEFFDVLPVDISLHIFSLLPVESVSDYALVTKSWKNFIHSPSFYTMHENRLMHLVEEALAECDQKIKEYQKYSEYVKQFVQTCQSRPMELTKQIEETLEETLEEKANSVLLAGEKYSNFMRLTRKCAEAKTTRVYGGSPFEAGGANQSVAKTLDLKRKVDVDDVVAAKEPTVKKQKVSENVEDPLSSWRKP